MLFFLVIGLLPDYTFGQQKKPNVLFIAVDDLNDYVSLLENHPGIKTPNLDEFAKTALNFENAYTAAPVCNPSRIAVLTGKSPVHTGIYENKDYFQNSEVAVNATLLPELFKENGYTTMWSGKIFHTGGSRSQTRPKAPRLRAMWDDMKGHDGGYGPWPATTNIPDSISRWFNYEGLERSPKKFPDIRNTDHTIERLRQEYDKPFFMALGLYRPHTPWTAPKLFFDRYPLDEIELPKILEDDLEDVPEIARKWARQPVKLEDLKKIDQWKSVVRAYMASVSFMDYNLGRVLDALEKSPHGDNTIVVLWADHGFHLGEKKHFAKFALWEQTTHVLSMMRVPGQTEGGASRDQPVNLLDIYPTLVELCDLSTPSQSLDGTSLVPVIEDENFDKKRPSITYHIKGSTSIRNDRWRYIRYYDGTEELYNEHEDPNEWHNLANQPKYEATIERLSKWLPEKIAPHVGKSKK